MWQCKINTTLLLHCHDDIIINLYSQVLDFFLSTYSSNTWVKVKQSLPKPNEIVGSIKEICICCCNDPGQFSGHEGKVSAQLLSIQLNCFLIPKTGYSCLNSHWWTASHRWYLLEAYTLYKTLAFISLSSLLFHFISCISFLHWDYFQRKLPGLMSPNDWG